MIVREDYYKGKRSKLFRFRREDVKIIVEGQEYSEAIDSFDEECDEFYKEYSYKDVLKAFKDFLELVGKYWEEVTLRIESNTEPELRIIFDKHYFIADFVVTLDELCKDSEKLKAIYKKISEIEEILRS